jgi:cytochrome c553
LTRKGDAIAHAGVPSRNVPACLGCHGGSNRNPTYPRLTGQSADYLKTQLHLFKAGKRGGTPYNHLMREVTRELTDADIAALAAYFSTLPRMED